MVINIRIMVIAGGNRARVVYASVREEYMILCKCNYMCSTPAAYTTVALLLLLYTDFSAFAMHPRTHESAGPEILYFSYFILHTRKILKTFLPPVTYSAVKHAPI